MRLWLDRHYRRRAGRRRLVLLLSALVAMALGAGVTLAFTQPGHGTATQVKATSRTDRPQLAAAARQQAAAWITREVASDITVGCDPVMCNELQRSGFPGSRQLPLQPSAPDPLGAQLVVATPVIRNQFGTRLATRLRAAGDRQLRLRRERGSTCAISRRTAARRSRPSSAAYRENRITAGRQLLGNHHIQASAAARRALLAGQVDPRLLVTLSTLAGLMPLQLIAFDDPSPGASADVPLRGAEIGAAASAGLPAMVAFMHAQQGEYAPAVARITQDASGRHVFIVRYDAPGPMELDGS